MKRVRDASAGRRLVEDWKRSGLSCKAFAERHGASRHQLGYWRRKLEPSSVVRRSRPRKRAQLVPVRLVEPSLVGQVAEDAVEVALGSGDRLRVGPGASEELLRRVVRVLRERC